jgi:hypothetical protein
MIRDTGCSRTLKKCPTIQDEYSRAFLLPDFDRNKTSLNRMVRMIAGLSVKPLIIMQKKRFIDEANLGMLRS